MPTKSECECGGFSITRNEVITVYTECLYNFPSFGGLDELIEPYGRFPISGYCIPVFIQEIVFVIEFFQKILADRKSVV